MALNTDEVYLPARGYIYTAPVDTSAPELLDTTVTYTGDLKVTTESTTPEWVNIGHTSSDDMPEFGYDGGDQEVKGTWQNDSLRVVQTEAVADYLVMNVHQFNNTTLGFYYGGDGGNQPGKFVVTGGDATTTDTALLVVIVDGPHVIAFHAPRVSVGRDDSIELDVEEFAALPLRASLLSPESGATNAYKFAWIAPGLGTAA